MNQVGKFLVHNGSNTVISYVKVKGYPPAGEITSVLRNRYNDND